MRLTASLTGDKAVRAELLRIGSLPAQALNVTAVKVEDFIRAEAGKHSKRGALVASIYKTRTSGGWELGHDLQRAPQALWVHWGTKPHVIRPKNKKALRWAAGGKFAFAGKVNHPGNKADPWLVRAAAQAPLIFEAQLAELLAANNKA